MDEPSAEPQQSADMPSMTAQSGNRRRWPMLIVGLAIGAVVTLVGLALVGGPVALAHRRDLPLEKLYGNIAVSLTSRFHSSSQATPVAESGRAVEAGRTAYTGSCAMCHGVDGKGNGVFGKATYPNATDLTTGNAKTMSDSQLYWIISNGLSFTGMPAFSSQYNSQDIWSIVSYIRTLQTQGSSASAVTVPTATAAQLLVANPAGTSAQKGAAVYFALGCQTCHGPAGNAPAELALRRGGEEATQVIRYGRNGMPAYPANLVSDAQLTDLQAYLATFTGGRGGERDRFGGQPTTPNQGGG